MMDGVRRRWRTGLLGGATSWDISSSASVGERFLRPWIRAMCYGPQVLNQGLWGSEKMPIGRDLHGPFQLWLSHPWTPSQQSHCPKQGSGRIMMQAQIWGGSQ